MKKNQQGCKSIIEETGRLIDEETRKLAASAYEKTRTLLLEH